MKIQIGKEYHNKTWKYLLPCLRGYDNAFVMRFNLMYKLAVGIYDSLHSNLAKGKYIYVLADTKYKNKSYLEFINFVRCQPYYITDYCYDADISKARRQMIVLEIPKQFHRAYYYFLKGKYSKMYTKEQLNNLYSSVLNKKVLSTEEKTRLKNYQILDNNKSIREQFIKTLNEEFNTDINGLDEEYEVELPLKRKEEIFNCKDNYKVFINAKNKDMTNTELIKNLKNTYNLLQANNLPTFIDEEEKVKTLNSLSQAIDDLQEGYEVISFPEVQEYMEQDWFDKEAILTMGAEDKFGSSAYFIPKNRLL